jgi:hypothetical protein
MLMLFYTGGDDDGVAAAMISCFQVILFNHPMHWQKEDGRIDLRVFSSDTGRWEAKQLDSQFAGGEAISAHPHFFRTASYCGHRTQTSRTGRSRLTTSTMLTTTTPSSSSR